MKPFLVMLAIVLITLAGDYLIKLASIRGGIISTTFLGGAAMYVISAIGIMIAMQHMSLASVGVWYSMLTILAMASLGVIVFGESLTGREIMGIGFAIASVACMTRLA